MQQHNTGLIHENGSPCEGGEDCKDLPHMVAATVYSGDARNGFSTLAGEPNVMMYVAALEEQLLNCSSALVTLSQLASRNRPLHLALRFATIMIHGSRDLLQTAVAAQQMEMEPMAQLRANLKITMTRVTELMVEFVR